MILTLGTTPAVQRSMIFDRLKIDSTNRTANVQQYASGKSINAARVLQTLGTAAVCTGFIGGDSGQFLLSDLDGAGIEHCFIRVDEPTRLCTTLIDRAQGTATELIEESRALPAHCYEQLLIKLKEILPRISLLMLCGSLTPGAPQDFYARCVSEANAAGKMVVLDATGQPLQNALSEHPTVIKPNRQELSQTVGAAVETDQELKAAIGELLANGPRWAVVTNGSKETIASDGELFWKISTPPVKVVSPIGSGDSFAAGLAAGLVSGSSVPEACRLAVACGGANAMTDKAGFIQKVDVDALLSRVEVERV
jgi:tagatose 6-phosphate kinase